MAKTWAQRYEGYALRQAQGIRNRLVEEVQQLKKHTDDAEMLERAEARLASWDELLITYVKAKKPEPTAAAYTGLPRKVAFSVTVQVSLVEEKPTEVSVIPVGEMTRKTAGGLAYAALAEAGFDGAELDSNGFSPAGAFFGVRLPE